MKIQYITTDFEFESQQDLNAIVQELDGKLVTQSNQWANDRYFVSLSGTGSEIYEEPEQTISEFCNLIEGLSKESAELWKGCVKRIADIAFESGSEPNHMTYNLSSGLINRIEKLGISVAITIYPIGTYKFEE
jgi:hypothetical protein